MKRFKVFITRKIPSAGIELLYEKGYDVDVHVKDSPLDEKIFINKIKYIDALIPLLSDKIDKRLIDQAPNLKVIANYAAGYNNIDVKYARSKKIEVTNTPDVLTSATADLTWALILSLSKRVVEGDRFLREGKFKGWAPLLMLGGDVTGKTLGIIGAGRIGQAVARRAKGFDMTVLYASSARIAAFEDETNSTMINLEELLSRSDYISIHCPLTEDTHHLINAGNINQIKQGAYLINTARGPVVEEKALADALVKGRLSGAGLDVYEFEPRVTKELLALKNVVLLPHVGSATLETRSEMARIAARNVIAVLEHGKALNPVP
jgi:glyoxylate reductase